MSMEGTVVLLLYSDGTPRHRHEAHSQALHSRCLLFLRDPVLWVRRRGGAELARVLLPVATSRRACSLGSQCCASQLFGPRHVPPSSYNVERLQFSNSSTAILLVANLKTIHHGQIMPENLPELHFVLFLPFLASKIEMFLNYF
jgi:hypothetical protein